MIAMPARRSPSLSRRNVAAPCTSTLSTRWLTAISAPTSTAYQHAIAHSRKTGNARNPELTGLLCETPI